jgi:uncharacterized protein YecE (DUF72 family)
LVGAAELLQTFLAEVAALEEKLGCLLVQLPPSLSFDAIVAERFLANLRQCTAMPVACEPRHASWFGAEADALLEQYRVARVAADPARVPTAGIPGGWKGISYYRLHGAPKVYYSAYGAEFITGLAAQLQQDLAAGRSVWCIFDNTTLGAATRNALDLASLLIPERIPHETA